jgi:hypothetical protein
MLRSDEIDYLAVYKRNTGSSHRVLNASLGLETTFEKTPLIR